jgi:hypothetical protein
MGLVVAVSAVATVAPVQAADPIQLNCTLLGPGGGNGGSDFTNLPGTDIWTWNINGIASCSSQTQGGQYEAFFTGTGKSNGLGACSPAGVVNNLSILVDITFTRVDTGTSITDHENWGAGTTTFPETTPFTITQNGQAIGYGDMFTHIFDHCPPGGTRSTVFQWTQAL